MVQNYINTPFLKDNKKLLKTIKVPHNWKVLFSYLSFINYFYRISKLCYPNQIINQWKEVKAKFFLVDMQKLKERKNQDQILVLNLEFQMKIHWIK